MNEGRECAAESALYGKLTQLYQQQRLSTSHHTSPPFTERTTLGFRYFMQSLVFHLAAGPRILHIPDNEHLGDSLFADAGVNYRHLGLLIDSMTRNGRLMSVDRYGINKNNIGPLAKASFEETEKILLRAALFGEMDPVTGVSAKIMTGQPMRGGTTFSQLLLDEAAFMRLQKGLPPVADAQEEDVEELDDDDIAEELAAATDDKCNAVRLRMNTVMPDGDVDLEEPDVVFNVLE
jgi:hypothetical protein